MRALAGDGLAVKVNRPSYYLIWFYPLLLVAVIQPPREHRDTTTLTNSTERIVQMPLAAAGNTAHVE